MFPFDPSDFSFSYTWDMYVNLEVQQPPCDHELAGKRSNFTFLEREVERISLGGIPRLPSPRFVCVCLAGRKGVKHK